MSKNWKQIVSDVLFFGALAVWLAYSIMRLNSTPDSALWEWSHTKGLFQNVRIGCFAALAVREFVDRQWNLRTLVGAAVFALLAWIAYPIGSTSLYVFGAVVFVFAGRNVPFQKIALFCFVYLAICCALVLLSVPAGLNFDMVKYNLQGAQRHGLGFYHPNTVAAFAFTLMALWAYLRRARFGIVDAFGFVVVNLVVYHFTLSRTALLMGLALTVVALVVARWLEGRVFKSRVAYAAVLVTIPIVAVIGIALPLFYDYNSSLMISLNDMMSGRLQYGNKALFGYGVTLLGQKVKLVPEIAYAVDIAYVRTLISLGVVFLIVVLVLSVWAVHRCYQRGEWMLLAIIVMMAVWGLSETCCMYLEWNPFLFVLGSLFALGSNPTFLERREIKA